MDVALRIEQPGDSTFFRIEYVVTQPHFKERCKGCQWLGGYVFDLPYICSMPKLTTRFVDLFFHDGDYATLYVRHGHDLEDRIGLRFSLVKKLVSNRNDSERGDHEEYFPAFEEAFRRVEQRAEKLRKEDPRASV